MQLPVGYKVDRTGVASVPERKDYMGKYVCLSPVDPERDAEDLFEASHGSEENLAIWKYMPYSGPFKSVRCMKEWLHERKVHKDFVFLTVIDLKTNKAVGMVGFLMIVPDMWRLELGFIWYHPKVQRTKINTETIFLMLCEAFDNLNYRRIEWKCDSLNEKSKAAALRLGFQFEALFKSHMIVNGFNRDTAWFVMLEENWPDIRQNIANWLYGGEPFSLTEINQNLNLNNEAVKTL